MAYKYSYEKFDKESMARSCGQNLSVSFKKSVEVARAIRGKKLSYAISYLEKVADQKAVVPYIRFKAEMGHKKGKGIDTGGYPVNVANAFLRLLKSAQKNASEQEISGELYIKAVSARKGTKRYHAGRYSGRVMKSTNIEVIVAPKSKKKVEEVIKK